MSQTNWGEPHMSLSRRTFLRGAGVAVALPLLETMSLGQPSRGKLPRRMVCLETNMGIPFEASGLCRTPYGLVSACA